MRVQSLTCFGQHNASGGELFVECCRHINLYELDYFGIEYYSKGNKMVWVEPEKPLTKQVDSPKKVLFHFSVKFYLADPGQLHDEFTKYLFGLQVKKDLANGRLPCSENTAALMASYILQAEVGDYNPVEHEDGRYITNFRFVPNQQPSMESKIQEYHKNHIGQTPADADFNLLDVARRLEMYGVRLYPARDYENVQLNLAVCHQGVLVFQSNARINTFSWAKIRKVSFKRKRFLIKLHPEGFGYPRSTVEFLMGVRNDCKRFWKACVEHHTFFRLSKPGKPRIRNRLMSRGSTFRFSGKTQKQVVETLRTVPPRPSMSLNASRTSSRSLGAPRTTTPLAIDMTETIVSDHQSTPNLTYNYQEGARQNGTPQSESASSPPSSTPVTPKHDNSRITIHKGQSSSSITYEYTVTEDHQRQVSPTETNKGGSGDHDVSSAAEESQEAVKQPTANGEAQPAVDAMSSPVLSPSKTITATQESSTPVQDTAQEDENHVKKVKRHPPDKAYFIAKEILTTERTYLKDLEVIVVWFRRAAANEVTQPDMLENLFEHLEPIYDFHCKFLKEIEQRLTSWEGRANTEVKGSYQGVGDIMLKNVQHLKVYNKYLEKLEEILNQVENLVRKNKSFETFYREFEVQKVCYLPFNTFLLKPLQRLLHYQLILDRLVKYYPETHPDYKDCKAAVAEVGELTSNLVNDLKQIGNFLKLTELQRDLVGMDNLVQPGRQFIREGCLHKLSRKGYQQRMFFLFSDMLLYTSKGVTSSNQFKVHGQIPLKGVVIEDSELDRSVANCFTLYGGNKTVVIAASNPEEKDRWMSDIKSAMALCQDNETTTTVTTPDQDSAFDESEDDVSSPSRSLERQSNTGPILQYLCAGIGTPNQLSGFLLRKFKNSNGWQKLWVVFTNFCLFFYKSYQDGYPLASLPLLGYTITQPGEEDEINKDYVFKLQFKTHVYFFRAESEYTFYRWMEVLKTATYSSKVEES
ncbi:putative FERM, RhoGEF and pleckstrin domain-containing protein 2 [Apostichopus japonicus]|uniref:FERM, ARHGEF and pleckstrin domain-containing protein 1 n=1 Tax=Stichopus japonicus TaxID=307972 RepID=A0A2G8L5W6_STIJA|nr:putative FERM, RhoGEF and pleckstrin domain-containing protein 2 [Apostichopus japonicus]